MRADIGADHGDKRAAQSEHQRDEQIFEPGADAIAGDRGGAQSTDEAGRNGDGEVVCTVIRAATASTRRMSAKSGAHGIKLADKENCDYADRGPDLFGYPDQSLARVSEALALARDLAQPYSIAFAHYMTSVVHLLRGDAARALDSAERSLEMSREQRFSLYVLLSTISRGRALGEVGRLQEAVAEIQTGIAEGRRTGIGFMLPMMYSWLADVHAQSGDNETAVSIIEQTLRDISDATGRSGLLDLTVYGRQETWEDSPPGWPKWPEGAHQYRTDGRPIVQWPRLKAGYSDDLLTGRQ
jgi:tetratricopeptide (TPR) repeat protein